MATEKRLIDANALIAYFEELCDIAKKDTEIESAHAIAALKCCIDLFQNFSTVEAVEVVHGRWVQKEFWPSGGTWRCSECGYQFMFMEDTPATKRMHYCPNCGARMDGERKDDDI